MESEPLDSHPLFKTFTWPLVEKVISEFKHSAVHAAAFKRIADVAEDIKASLEPLRCQNVSALDLNVCNKLHQVRFIMMEALEFQEQYEDKIFQAPFVFTEVYNLEVNRLLQALVALRSALPAKGSVPDTTCLKLQDLSKFMTKRPDEDFTRHLAGPTVVSLAAALVFEGENAAEVVDLPYVVRLAVHGQWHKVDTMLRDGSAEITEMGPVYSLLHMAVLWQNPFAIAMLIGHGADPNVLTLKDDMVPHGSSALHIAATMGHAQSIKLLICSGASREIKDSQGKTPWLLNSSRNCKLALNGALLLLQRAHEMCSAAYDGNFAKLPLLMQKHDLPLNIKARQNSSFFLLHQVAYGGHPQTYLLLVEAGASPLLRTKDHRLPSEVAAQVGHEELSALMRAREASALTMTADPHMAPLRPHNLNLSFSRHPTCPTPGSQSPASPNRLGSDGGVSTPRTPDTSPAGSPWRRAMHKMKDKVRHSSPRRPH